MVGRQINHKRKTIMDEQDTPNYTTRIWSYDVQQKREARISKADLQYCDAQLGLNRKYYNQIIAREIDRRQAVIDARLRLFPEYDELEQEAEAAKARVAELRDALKKDKQKARKN